MGTYPPSEAYLRRVRNQIEDVFETMPDEVYRNYAQPEIQEIQQDKFNRARAAWQNSIHAPVHFLSEG